jgi:NitT/TauT family transport system permease protein
MRRFILASLFFIALVAAWQALALSGRWSPVLLPSPGLVGEYLWSALWDGSLLEAIGVTLRRLLVGYVIRIAIGLPLGLLSSRFTFFEDTIGVLALGLQTLPSVCWVPLALLWFGQSEGAMLFVVVMGSAWSLAIATDTGARTIPRVYARAARTMGSEGFHQWTRVILPASLPYLISGMKQGWAFAWRSLMAAEIFVTILTGFGLGQLLHYGRELNAMDQVIGIMVIIVAIGLLADKVLFAPWEQFLHRRWGTGSAVAA